MTHQLSPREVKARASSLPDLVVSLIRTAVPGAWGALIAWLLTVAPLDPDGVLVGWLRGQTEFVVLAVIVLWYALWRWLEPRIPAWLVALVLGSAATPTYSAVVAIVEPDGTTVAGPASPLPDGTPLVVARWNEDPHVTRWDEAPPVDDVTFRPGAVRREPPA